MSGAVATVSTKVLENRPVLTVGQALQGSVANMTVSIGSGQATDSPSFNIRGTTSINGGDPLVVIDGVVSTAEELNRMNPSDIGSISVLKDASATAVYGVKGANGVILVTTKRGTEGAAQINIAANATMKIPSKLPNKSDSYDALMARNMAIEHELSL